MPVSFCIEGWLHLVLVAFAPLEQLLRCLYELLYVCKVVGKLINPLLLSRKLLIIPIFLQLCILSPLRVPPLKELVEIELVIAGLGLAVCIVVALGGVVVERFIDSGLLSSVVAFAGG